MKKKKKTPTLFEAAMEFLSHPDSNGDMQIAVIGALPAVVVYGNTETKWSCPYCAEENTATDIEEDETCMDCGLRVNVSVEF